MKITHPATQVVMKRVDCICNKCGQSLKRYIDFENKHFDMYGITEFEYGGGYLSGNHGSYTSKLGDCTTYRFSICEDCLSSLFDSFRIPVYVVDDYVGEDNDFQDKLNKLYETESLEDIVPFLVDEDESIRRYAEIKTEQLKKK